MKTPKHNMPVERYRGRQAHLQFCGMLAGRRMNLWLFLPAITAFSFVQEVMGKHARFSSRLAGRRSLSRYFAGLNFIFALPVLNIVAANRKFTLRIIERLIAVQPLAGGVSPPRAVVAPPIAQTTLNMESRPFADSAVCANSANSEIVFWTPLAPSNIGRGQEFPNSPTDLRQSHKSLLDFSRQQFVNNLSYNSGNIFSGTKIEPKTWGIMNRQWPKQSPARQQHAGDEHDASAIKARDARRTPDRFRNDLTMLAMQTGMPAADAEATHASDDQAFSVLQNLIAAQPRYPDFSPEKRFRENSSGKNYPMTATAPELIHKAFKAADGKSQAQPPVEKDSNTAKAVARHRLKPVGIAEPPMPEAFRNLDRLADHVITIIEKRLQTERERRGIFT